MPAKWFRCPDGEVIEITECLQVGGCRMGERCATRPYLRLAGENREFTGKVSPSQALNGPMLQYLKGIIPYVVGPEDMVWAAFGTGTHGKLSIHKYTYDVFSEEELSDEKMKGISDVLDQSERDQKMFDLFDYKTWGSFKLAKALGIIKCSKEVPVEDEHGNVVILKSGKNKGQPKMKKEYWYIRDEDRADLKGEELQLNMYRIFFEKYGYMIADMFIQAIPRDGGTYVAEGRGITKNLYIIPVKRLPDEVVLRHYDSLQAELTIACKTGQARFCNVDETWGGARCRKYCEVADACAARGRPENWRGE